MEKKVKLVLEIEWELNIIWTKGNERSKNNNTEKIGHINEK